MVRLRQLAIVGIVVLLGSTGYLLTLTHGITRAFCGPDDLSANGQDSLLSTLGLSGDSEPKEDDGPDLPLPEAAAAAEKAAHELHREIQSIVASLAPLHKEAERPGELLKEVHGVFQKQLLVIRGMVGEMQALAGAVRAEYPQANEAAVAPTEEKKPEVLEARGEEDAAPAPAPPPAAPPAAVAEEAATAAERLTAAERAERGEAVAAEGDDGAEVAAEKDDGYEAESPVEWKCDVCKLAPADKPTLYIMGRDDGLGSQIMNMISGMALAAKVGMNFGGSIGEEDRQIHGVQIWEEVRKFFGAPPRGSLFFLESSLTFDKVFKKGRSLENMADSMFGTLNVYLQRNDLIAYVNMQVGTAGQKTLDFYYTPDFMTALRATVQPAMDARFKAANVFAQPDKPWVAMHIRRGDVINSPKHRERFMSDEFYLKQVSRVRKHLPDADVHVWSSTEGVWSEANFSMYKERNMTVHLDGDPLDAWANFAAADVLIMAKSAFSQVPALLNTRCVVYQPDNFGVIPLSGWVSGAERGARVFDPKLKACLQNLAPRN